MTRLYAPEDIASRSVRVTDVTMFRINDASEDEREAECLTCGDLAFWDGMDPHCESCENTQQCECCGSPMDLLGHDESAVWFCPDLDCGNALHKIQAAARRGQERVVARLHSARTNQAAALNKVKAIADELESPDTVLRSAARRLHDAVALIGAADLELRLAQEDLTIERDQGQAR